MGAHGVGGAVVHAAGRIAELQPPLVDALLAPGEELDLPPADVRPLLLVLRDLPAVGHERVLDRPAAPRQVRQRDHPVHEGLVGVEELYGHNA
ncbi:hypothetical protein [Actinacidiphila glaucinigra]|uniref:hypothetical protein n=1 Tax=Actinacidiphila glaucinigra TaxID=235986 RepID=UPI00371E3F2D